MQEFMQFTLIYEDYMSEYMNEIAQERANIQILFAQSLNVYETWITFRYLFENKSLNKQAVLRCNFYNISQFAWLYLTHLPSYKKVRNKNRNILTILSIL